MAGAKILIIDDDPDIQAILRACLSKAGYQVSSAMDAMQGTMMARKDPPALVFLDVMMPAGGGMSVFDRLRQNSNTLSVPIIIYSAVPIEQLRQKVPPDVPILTKPQNLENILAEVKKVIG
jgi:DNA-binding response OmpR family regulator